MTTFYCGASAHISSPQKNNIDGCDHLVCRNTAPSTFTLHEYCTDSTSLTVEGVSHKVLGQSNCMF